MVKTIFVVCVHDGDGNMIPDKAFSIKAKANKHAKQIWNDYKKDEFEADFDNELEVHEIELEE